MIKKCLSISLIILLPFVLFSQTSVLPVFKNGKWAVMDTSLQITSPFQYKELIILKNDYLLARISENYGVIDKNLHTIIPFDYQDIKIAGGEFFIVKKQGHEGLINISGMMILPCEFDNITLPDSSIAIMKNQDTYSFFRFSDAQQENGFSNIEAIGNHVLLLEKSGKKYLFDYLKDIKSVDFNEIAKNANNLFFCKDFAGNKFVIIHRDKFYYTPTKNFSFFELPANKLIFKVNDSLHVVDQNLKLLAKVKATRIFKPVTFSKQNSMGNLFSQEFYVYDDNGLKGLLNSDFQVIINAAYDEIFPKKDNFLVLSKGKSGLITKSGKLLIVPQYDYFEPAGDYWLVKNNNLWGSVSPDGKEIIAPGYEKVTPIFDNLFIVSLQRKSGVIDKNNRQIIPIAYQKIRPLTNRLLLINNKHCGLANTNGEILLPTDYEYIEELNPEYFLFTENGKSGILNLNGKVVVEPQFEKIIPTKNNNLFFVQSSAQFSADEIRTRFDKTVSASEKHYKTGIINVRGEILLETDFYLQGISIDYQTNTIIAEEKSSVLVVTFEENGKLLDKTIYKNYISVKSGPTVPEKNIWKEGNRNQHFYYGLFTPRGSKLIDYRFKSIVQQFLNHPDLVKVYSPGGKSGIVNERTGKILLQDVYKVIYTDDFKQSALARCVKSSGRTVLIDSLANIREKGIGYMDDFSIGYARINRGGSLTYKDDYAHKLDLDKEHHVIPKRKENQEGRDLVCEGGKWGVMDSTGQWVIQPQYQFIQAYANQVFIVQKGSKWGVVSTNNDLVIDFTYDELRYFKNTKSDYWAQVPYFKARQSDKWGVIDKNGKQIISPEYDDIELLITKNRTCFKTVEDSRKIMFGLVNEQGELVLAPKYEFIGHFKEGLATVQLNKKCWKFINLQMKELSDECFFEIHDFHEGLAAVKTNKGWGFLNISGEIAIPAQYIEVGDFHEGLAKAKIYIPAKLGGLIKSKRYFVIIDKKGAIQLKTKSKYCSDVSNGQLVIKKGRNFQVINTKGRKILPGFYKEIIENSQYGLYAVKNKQRKFGLYNSKSELLVPFGQYKRFSEFSEGLCYAESIISGFIDTLGHMKIPIECREAKNFHEGLAAIKFNEGWGYIDSEGVIAIPPQYNYAWDFIDGTAKVQDLKNKNFYINNMGENVNLTSYASNDQYRIITENNYQGIMAADGHLAVYPAAPQIGIFKQGYAPVGIQKQFGLYGSDGMKISNPVYLDISVYENGFIKLVNLGEVSYIK